jgi:hypothetical protein
MLLTLCLVTTILAPQVPNAVALPDTPQGKRVDTYIKAFNTGDQKRFLTVQDELLVPDVLKKRTLEERTQLYERMKGDFGSLVPTKVAKATAEQIQILVPTKEGDVATFTFDFEPKAPYRISGIRIDVGRGDR